MFITAKFLRGTKDALNDDDKFCTCLQNWSKRKTKLDFQVENQPRSSWMGACMCMHVCMGVCMHVCMHWCVHVCIHAGMHACVCLYVCLCSGPDNVQAGKIC